MLKENHVRAEPPVIHGRNRFLEKSSMTVDCSLTADCFANARFNCSYMNSCAYETFLSEL